ncbi:MAG: hypothetical protein ABJL54_08135 [Halioglobus sp.]
MRIRKKHIALLYVISLLMTEFYVIEFLGGSLRPFHFLTVAVLVSLYGYLPGLIRNPIFWFMSAFLLVNILAAAMAENPPQAYKSLGLLIANMSIAVAIALVLMSGLLRLQDVIEVSFLVAAFGILVGVTQVAILKLTGIDLSISEAQSGQISSGFSTGFKTEANTFAKYLNIVLLLNLPVLLAKRTQRSSRTRLFILVVGFLTSFTRSVLYPMPLTLFLIYYWYQSTARGAAIRKRPFFVLALTFIGAAVFILVVPSFNEYTAHKLKYFFDMSEILEGSSSAYRLNSQEVMWDAYFKNIQTILIGNGWGQVYYMVGGEKVQAGGAELLTVFAYGGLFAGIFYLVYMLTAIVKVHRKILMLGNEAVAKSMEGVLFALVGMLVTGQLNGAMIAPEYWMVLGMAIYVGGTQSSFFKQ